MADTRSREDYIAQLVGTIRLLEGREGKQADRAYLLELVAEAASAVDGKKKQSEPVAPVGKRRF